MNDLVHFDFPPNQSSVIKVVGVGGGGSNAVNHMFNQGIKGVDFIVCNTDAQALNASPIPNKIQLGISLTEGLGAGANPEVGMQAAQESLKEIMAILEKNTRMVFITAGMGGGTGTGAAPIIAKAAKEKGILTVGIVTIPFAFEGTTRSKQAEEGVERLRQAVDSLIVINNNKLREVYGNLGFKAGFGKADEVLATAAKGIAEVIMHHFTTNIDLRDARTVLANSGTAIMGSAKAEGEHRAQKAIEQALNSPLLNDNHIKGASNVLLLIVSGQDEITLDEISEISEHVQRESGGTANIILGIGEDESLGNSISTTVIATGFAPHVQNQVIQKDPPRVVHILGNEHTPAVHLDPKSNHAGYSDSRQASPKKTAEERPSKNPNVLQTALFPLDVYAATAAATPPSVQGYDVKTESSHIEKPIDVNITTSNAEVEMPTGGNGDLYHEPTSEEAGHFVFFDINPDPEAQIQTLSENGYSDWMNEQPSEETNESDLELDHDVSVPQTTPRNHQPVTNQTPEETRKVYTLEDYEEHTQMLNSAQPPLNQEIHDPELDFKLQQGTSKPTNLSPEVPQEPAKNLSLSDSNIFDSPIPKDSEKMKLFAAQRRERLSSYMHTFNNSKSSDHDSHIPAYKRQGIDVTTKPNYSKDQVVGKLTIEGEGQSATLKNNNRFLHDNVD